MTRGERLAGAGAVVMAACCALLPLVGAAVGGGLVAEAGEIGVVVGAVVLVAVVADVLRRRARGRC